MRGDGEMVERLRLAAKPEELASVFTLTVVRCSLLREAADRIEKLYDHIAIQDDSLDHMGQEVDFMERECERLTAENVRLRGLA
jgi:hypothetical protein